MMLVSQERRAYPRLSFDLSKRITGEIKQTGSASSNTVYLLDLSEEGSCVEGNQQLGLDSRIELTLNLPDTSVTRAGKIIWVYEEGKDINKIRKFGIKFNGSMEENRIRKYLSKNSEYINLLLKSKLNGCDVLLLKEIYEFLQLNVRSYILDLQFFEQQFNSKSPNGDYDVFKIDDLSKRITYIGYDLEKKIASAGVSKKIKTVFRHMVSEWVYKSEIMKRAYEKPRGYPGDYYLLETTYNNRPISKGIGFCFDVCFLNNPLAIAVRNRKDWLKEFLKKEWGKKGKKIKILNLACGSCREIKEAIEEANPLRDVEIIAVDQDKEALDFSKSCIGTSIISGFEFKVLQKDVMAMTKDVECRKELQDLDCVYSIGLADYLPDRVFKKVTEYWYHLLKPGGRLILAHKDVDIYHPILHDWLCDWTFYPRNEIYFIELLKEIGIPSDAIKIEREQSKHIYFATITKY
jgi:SAM-dependent methyltransferase